MHSDLILYEMDCLGGFGGFKTAIQEETTIYDTYKQLIHKIPKIFQSCLNTMLCVISDGVNTKTGSAFARVRFFLRGLETEGCPNENKIV